MRKGIVFFDNYYEGIKDLDPLERLHIYEAIFEYAFRDTKVELNKIEQLAFNLIQPSIDISINRYDASVENGKKGGRPKTGNLEKPKITYNNLEKPSETYENLEKPNHNLKKEKEKEKEKNKKKEKEEEAEKENLNLLLPPPSLSQVLDYVKEKELKCDGRHFYDYYEASGWIDKDGNVISNWKQKLLNWSKSEHEQDTSSDLQKVRSADVIDFDQFYANLRDD